MKKTLFLIFIAISQILYGQINWTYNSIGVNGNILSVCFINANTGWAAEVDGVYKTTNKGISFSLKKSFSGYMDADIYFINENTGYISANNKIYKTVDCGNNWNECYTFPTSSEKNTIKFANANTGYACLTQLNRLDLYKTTNSGASWYIAPACSSLYTNIGIYSPKIWDIDFVYNSDGTYNPNKVIIVGVLPPL